jgi:MFS family permease
MRAIAREKKRMAKMRLRRVRRVRQPPPPRPVMAWLVWLASAIFVLFQFSLQLSSGEIVAGLMHSFSLGAVGAGVLASAYYYVYVLLQCPAGMVVDRYGPRYVLTVGALVCGLGTFVFAHADGVVTAIIGRMLMGGGAAFAFVGSLYLVGKWFPVHRFSFMVGVAEAIGMIGSLLGSLYMAEVVEDYGWRSIMMLATFVAFGIAVLIFLVVRNTPYPQEAPKSFRPRGAFRRDVGRLLSSRQVWISGAYSSLMFGVIAVFVSLWAVPYLQLAQHVSLLRATVTVNMVFVGVALGSPLCGWLDARVNRRHLLMAFSLLATALICLIVYVHLSEPWLVTLLLLLGVAASAYVIPFAVAHEQANPKQRSAYIGFINMLSVGSAPIFQPLVGVVMTLVATHFYQQAYVSYSLADYGWGLSLVPLMTLVAAILARFMPLRHMPARVNSASHGKSTPVVDQTDGVATVSS